MNNELNYFEDSFRIYSHQNFDNLHENIDFYIEIKSHTYRGSAFTINSILEIMTRQGIYESEVYSEYFWSANFIILKEFTLDCLINAVRDLVTSGDYTEAFFYLGKQA